MAATLVCQFCFSCLSFQSTNAICFRVYTGNDKTKKTRIINHNSYQRAFGFSSQQSINTKSSGSEWMNGLIFLMLLIIYFTFQFIFGSPTNSMYICFFLVPLCVIRIYRYPQFSEIAFQKENKIPIFSANENNLSLTLLHGWLGTEFIWASCFAYILKWWPRNETFHNFVFFFFFY